MDEPVEHVRKETDSTDDLTALLEGRCFHVTLRGNWPRIKAAGAVLPNADGSLTTTFGRSDNSFFRTRNCVSVFDWRDGPAGEPGSFRSSCWPFQPAEPGNTGVAVLLLRRSVENRLLAWKDVCAHCHPSQMIVPHVEAGHPGPIPLADIENVFYLRIVEDPEDPYAEFRRALASDEAMRGPDATATGVGK